MIVLYVYQSTFKFIEAKKPVSDKHDILQHDTSEDVAVNVIGRSTNIRPPPFQTLRSDARRSAAPIQ